MKEYRILIWFPDRFDYYDGIFKSLNVRDDTVCKDKSNFGFHTDYYSQKDYEKIHADFHENIILLYQITRNELFIDVSEDVIVWSYIDDIFGKYVMIGKDYFKNFPKNNYLYLPVLDTKAFDLDGVMQSEELCRKTILAPFVPFQSENYDRAENVEMENMKKEKYACDVALVLYRRRIGDSSGKRMAGINQDNSFAKDAIQLLGFLYVELKKKILEQGHIVMDTDWIERLLIRYFDKNNFWQSVRNKESLLERWKKFALYIVNVNLYGEIVADWLTERDYDLKLYGGWQEKKYRKYSGGFLKDGSKELYDANCMAKIGINSNPMITIHRRTLDCISSGTMCLSAGAGTKEFDEKCNFSHYSHYFEDQKSIVMFYNKEELFHQIDYYLAHDKEREKIARAGKSVILERKLNYQNVVSQAFNELIDRMESNGDKVVQRDQSV